MGIFCCMLFHLLKILSQKQIYSLLLLLAGIAPMSTISINSSSSSSSSCSVVLSLCDMDESCRWHLSELRIKCGEHRNACERRRRTHCAQAVHRFVTFVGAPLAQAMVFCTCAEDDVDCHKEMFPFINQCSLAADQPNWGQVISYSQWSCTQTMKLCRLETDCRRRLSLLRSACPIAVSPQNASVVRCAIPNLNNSNISPSLSACRTALTAARGSWLDAPCICPATEVEGGNTSCAELAETKWPEHPCIGMIRDHFNEQFRNGQLRLELPTYTMRGNSLATNGAANGRHLSEKDAMKMGGELSVLTMTGRRRNDGDELAALRRLSAERQLKKPLVTTMAQKDSSVAVSKEKNGRKKEVYQWKWVDVEGKERARKLDSNDEEEKETEIEADGRGTDKADGRGTDKADGRVMYKANGRGTDKADIKDGKQRRRKNETDLVLDNNRVKQWMTNQQLNNNNNERHKLETDDEDGKGEREAEWQRKIGIRERQKSAAKLLDKNGDQPTIVDEETMEKTFFTPKQPIEEDGCRTRNVDGEWVTHHGDTVFRHYHDWAGRCSSWCECKSNGSLQCQQIGCLSDAQCEALHTAIGFGQRLYLEDRGACQCHDGGRFICDTSELMGDLSPGLYITMGYSKAELDLIRKNVPKSVLETSGLISQSTSHAKDLAARVQFALERVLPESTKCRVVLFEHFAKEEIVLLQIQWFGVEPSAEKKTAQNSKSNGNGKEKAKWQSGKWEKFCAPFVRELELTFLLERADRYQLLLSTIKQIRVIDLLGALPPAALSATSSAAKAEQLPNLFFVRLFPPRGTIIMAISICSPILFHFLLYRFL